MTRSTSALIAALVLVFAVAAAPRPAEDPLLVEDVALLLRSGFSAETIMTDVRARGLAEPVTPEGERKLRAWGATETLIAALRARSAPQPAAHLPTPVNETAGGPGGASPAPGPIVFAVASRVVRVPVSVTDNKGQPVTDLKQGDFRVSEDGQPQVMDFFSRERKPLQIGILLDVSGSMETKIEEVADAMKHFMDLLEPADQLFILIFSSRPRLVQDFTNDRKRLQAVLRSLRAEGGTALHDALIESLEHLGPAQAESKAVVLITDGMDTASESSFREAIEAVRGAEVPVYSIGLGHGRGSSHSVAAHRDLAPDFDDRPLLDLAGETGGRAEILLDTEHHHRGGVDRLKLAAEAIALDLRHRYLLGYELADAETPRWREIRVTVDRPGVTVRARRGYWRR